jgi:hypothetical protein
MGLFLEPPGPLLAHRHTVYMANYERLPTRLTRLAERACFPQVAAGAEHTFEVELVAPRCCAELRVGRAGAGPRNPCRSRWGLRCGRCGLYCGRPGSGRLAVADGGRRRRVVRRALRSVPSAVRIITRTAHSEALIARGTGYEVDHLLKRARQASRCGWAARTARAPMARVCPTRRRRRSVGTITRGA